MSRSKKDGALGNAEVRIRRAAAYARPLAKNSSEVAKRGVHRTRARVAPTIERSGQALQNTLAPKVAELMSTAARRIAPDAPRRARWRKPVSVAGLTAAVGGVAALVTRRRKPEGPASADANGQGEAEPDNQTA